MDNNTKRTLLFLFGCILVRSGLVVAAKFLPPPYLKYMGILALIPALGFLVIFSFNLRKTGPETFGDKIWWNNLRPVHGILYLVFSYMAINGIDNAYIPLLIDVVLGFFAFLVHRLIFV